MIEDGLLVVPKFENIDEYLKSGTRTEITDIIKKASEKLKGNTDGITVRNILVWMNKYTERLHNGRDDRKFRRSATDILQSGERTGCCDSSTLFTTLARGAGIPTMQIITLSKKWGEDVDKGRNIGTEGHFFSGVYLGDIHGKYDWVLIDTDRKVTDFRDIKFMNLDKNNRNIRDLYTFAYVADYYDDLGIDSISEMSRVQLAAYRKCDKRDFHNERDIRDI